LIINISTAGDTLRHITDMMGGELTWWLGQDNFNALLFSAGGNDFIDAARKPPPGQGLLRDMRGQPLPPSGADCVDEGALDTLVNAYLNPNFDTIYRAVRNSSRNARTPILLNCYDTPVARNAPAAPGKGPWLYTAYGKNGIDASLWPALTARVFGA